MADTPSMGDLFGELVRRLSHEGSQGPTGSHIGFVIKGDEGLQGSIGTNSPDLTNFARPGVEGDHCGMWTGALEVSVEEASLTVPRFSG